MREGNRELLIRVSLPQIHAHRWNILNIGPSPVVKRNVSANVRFEVLTAVNTNTSSCVGHAGRSWLRHRTTSRKVAGSIPDGVIGILH